MWWRRGSGPADDPIERIPGIRNIIETSMHHRSARVAYLPGALDRVVASVPASARTDEQIISHIEMAIIAEERRAEEFPIEKWFLLGWFDWFDHAREMT